MPNLLELMNDNDRKIVAKLQRKKTSTALPEVSPISLQIAKLGYFYGWSAIEAVKRGYVEKGDAKIALTMEEVAMLVEAGEKVHAQHMVDLARATRAGTASALSDKHPKQVFEKGVEQFVKRARI